MWGCCQQLPPAQEQWKMLAKLWSRCLLPSSQQELSPSLCIPFRAQLPAWLGVPTQRGMRSSIQPLHCTEHSTAHTSAGAYDCARNGREHRALVQPESIPHNFQWISLGCTRLCIPCFTTDLSTCCNSHHFWDTFSGGSQPAYQPTADTDAHPLPTQGATAQPPQLRFFLQRFDPKQWNSDTDKKACPVLTHPRPVHGQQRATG